MELKLLVKKDYAGSSNRKYNRYTFGTMVSPINGGIYIDKDFQIPEVITLVFKKEDKGDG
jgi:hypothetical protein